MRVYRAIGEVSDATDGSLTIREGVSYKAGDKLGWYAVPSLYVRVYRRNCRGCGKLQRSLTIREGVSRRQIVGKTEAEFPHYT